MSEIEKLKATRQELLEKYATINGISLKEAESQIDAPTEEEILKKISEKTIEKINSTRVPLNRAQRRALKKKVGAQKYAELITESGNEAAAITETAKKLNYIDLIQKLRKLNEEKAKEIDEDGETATEDD